MNPNTWGQQNSSGQIVWNVLIRLLVGAIIFTTVVVLSSSAFAQRTTGTLRGQVLDPQGAVVADANITVVNQATGVEQTVSTSSAGTYNLPSMLPGSYMVTVEAKGFKRAVHKDVPVLADQDNVADAKLEVGSNTEVVEVMAGAAQVETTSSALNNNFDSRDVLNVPVAGGAAYSALNLAILAPNTIAQPGGTAGTGGAIGGTRPRDNSFSVDGVDDNNLGVTGPNSTVIFDAIQEFALQTNQFSAEYGHSAGGQFNIVTKTGTNNYHGSGEWYAQNRNFNSLDNLTKAAIQAQTPGLSSMPAYDNSRFGGTFGGPIIRNKWFFFGAYEYTDLHGEGGPTSLHAPTSAGLSVLQGMAIDSQVTNILNNFPVAPAADLAPICVHCADPTNPSTFNIPVGNLTIVSPNLQREHDAQFNTDYTWGHHQIGTRFLFNQEKTLFPVNSTQSVFNQNLLVRNRKIALTDAWSIKNSIVNDLRLQYSYYSQDFANPCGSSCPADVTLLDLGNSTIGPADVQTQKQNTYQIVDNLSWVHGKHTFKFGGQYTHFIYPQFFLSRSNGDYWYSSTQEFVDDLIPSQPGRTLRGAGSGSFLGTQSLLAAFVQDDIKVTPRLTLNLGLRYEFWTNPVGDKTQQLNAISNVPGVITFGVPKTDKNNIGPRLGFAYDPTGSGRTAIRGGIGVSYDVKFQNFASITLPPQISTELDPATSCTLTPTPSWCATGSGFLAGGGLPQTFPPPATAADARNLTTAFIDDTVMPKIFTWSLGVQHELYRNSTIEVRYLGTRGLELPVQYRRNFISYFDAGGAALPTYFSASSIPSTYSASTPTDANFYNYIFNYAFNCGTPNTLFATPGLTQSSPDVYQQYGFCGNVTSDPPKGSSIYHAGSVNFTHRAGHGFTFNANYTYAHTISNSDNEFHTSALNPRRAQDTNNINQDRGNSDLDVTHKVAVSLTYDLPKARSENVVLKALLNGYSLGSSFLAQSGQPVTIQSGVDSNGNFDSAGDRAVFNPSGSGNVLNEAGQGDVFPVCASTAGTASGVPVGNTYIGATSFLNAPLNGCAKNGSATFGFDPAIGYTPVNPNDRYVIAGGGALANIGRNSFRSPGFYTVNLSVSKRVHFTESKYLQLQASAFNIFNHPNYALSNGNVFGNGGITTALATPGYVLPFDGSFLQPKQFGGGIRSMILALKFVF
jgi:outer membrane receptor protein involved in Fe transport